MHLAYSNQIAQAQGAITGGLDRRSAAGARLFRSSITTSATRSTSASTPSFPGRSFAAINVYYGSGFSNGSEAFRRSVSNDAYLPGHTQIDLIARQDFGEKYTVSVNALNVANRHLLIDNSLTFGGFHYNNPRRDLRRVSLPVSLLDITGVHFAKTYNQ